MNHQTIQNIADAEGFSLMGIAPAISPTGYPQLLQWIEDGFAAEMNYFAERKEAYRHPNAVLNGVRSIVALAFPYPAFANREASAPMTGKVARYATIGSDYHDILHPKLKRICRAITELAPESKNRGVVDTAPLMEREFAQLAGLGWIGKNTLLINKSQGSYFFLASVLTSLELAPTTPHHTAHCGTCTACITACPTDAFPEPGRLDARKCISYLTIEHRDSIPLSLREKIGDWVFGCDICQEVCPWNRKPTRSEANSRSDATSHLEETLDLPALFLMDDERFREVFRKTPMWRPRRRGMLRNAAIVMGNQNDPAALPSLKIGLHDSDPIVRGSCAWAIGNLRFPAGRLFLLERQLIEQDPSVIEEIEGALKHLPPNSSSSPQQA